MAAKRKRYDDNFRASAVVMLEAAGYPAQKGALARVAAHVGVPAATLHRWARQKNNPPPSELVSEKTFDLLQAIRSELAEIFKAMRTERQDANYKDLGTVGGILMDKALLLEGKATERVDHTGLTRDERLARIGELLNGRRTGGIAGASRTTDD